MTSDGENFCDTSNVPVTTPTVTESTNPSTNQTGENEPEGFEVEERWICAESELEAYVTSDGRIICIEPEERPEGFIVEEEWHCTEGGG